MIRECSCNTLEEIQSLVSTLQEETGKLLYFRGQVKDRPFVPSINRPYKEEQEKQLYNIRHSIVENLVHEYYCMTSEDDKNIDYFMTVMSILQHYGLKSWFIDITTNVEVAIWFSKMKFHQDKVVVKNTSCHKEDGSPSDKPLDHIFSGLPVTSYKESEEEFGWVYIIGLDISEADIHILDLKSHVDSLRIQRQYGSGLFDPKFGDVDLNSFVIAKIKVPTKININPDMNMRYLFPSWEEDNIYKSLLNVPHIVTKENLKRSGSFSIDLIDIPIYIEEEKEIFSVSPYIRQLIGDYIHPNVLSKFPKDCAIISKPYSMKKVFPNNQYVDVYEEESKRNKRIESILLGEDSLNDLLSLWPTRHFIILYSAYEMIPRYIDGSSTYPIVRATRFDLKDDFIDVFVYNEDIEGTYESQVTHKENPEIYAHLIVELIDLSLDIEEKRLGIWKKGNTDYDLHWLDNEGKATYSPIGVKLN